MNTFEIVITVLAIIAFVLVILPCILHHAFRKIYDKYQQPWIKSTYQLFGKVSLIDIAIREFRHTSPQTTGGFNNFQNHVDSINQSFAPMYGGSSNNNIRKNYDVSFSDKCNF